MTDAELGAWLRLTLTPGVGNGTARKLLAAFGSPESVFRQPPDAWSTVVGQASGGWSEQIGRAHV